MKLDPILLQSYLHSMLMFKNNQCLKIMGDSIHDEKA